jgi:hypothetical protein
MGHQTRPHLGNRIVDAKHRQAAAGCPAVT